MVGAPRDQSCARRERWDRLGFRAAARRGSGCRRSYARSGPLPLPPRGQGRGRSHLFTQKGTLFTILMSLLGLRGTGPALAAASWWRKEGSGEARRRSAPTGHRIPAQGETLGYGTQPERSEGTPHTPGFSRLFCSGRAGAGAGDQCLDGVWRISAGGAPRDMSRCGLVASKGLG